jgi:2-polyprenyl-3-methyl-5-hydroxy-6-metoxy-1,4-benzoquinol methylase
MCAVLSRQESSLPWYAEWFGRDYLAVYAHRDTDEARRQIALMERALAPASGARVLDLCCGGGRHSVELARRGYKVLGVDLSSDLLGAAQAYADENHVDITFVRADMRTCVADGVFDVVVNFFTSFGYFESDDENARVLRAIRTSLRPGGGWMMDYLNRESVIKGFVPRDERTLDGMHLIQERRLDIQRGRILKTLTIRRGDDTRTYHESVRMYTPPELFSLCSGAGLKVTQVFGSYDGAPFAIDSPRLILAGTTT